MGWLLQNKMGNKAIVSMVVILMLSVSACTCDPTKLSSSNSFPTGGEREDNDKVMKIPSPRFRLPKTIIPSHYNLQMLPILENVPGYPRFNAIGRVQISVECRESTSSIILHALNLTIDHSSVKVISNGNELVLSGLSYDTEKDFFIIGLETNLEVGQKCDVAIEFIAPIPEDRLNGMYLDYYDHPTTGERRFVATTLFAPYHTRRAFPCFDEPNFRATYNISLGRHENYHSMSNAEIIDSYEMENLPGWHWDIFNTTPSISSYIVAMIVSDFQYEEAPGGSFGDKPVRVYAPHHLIEMGAGVYSSQLTADILTYFEEYFVVKYPITKMFSVALPHFFFNAMENWGLITYKDPILLYFPNQTSEAERYRINYVVGHELAHQWFGNLVNCEWWAYVWLKEGFATFYSHYGINHTHPELEPWTQFLPNVRQVAMEFDASNNTHPLENFPPTSSAVADIYTRIPYEKGASVLRMASSFLGENLFTVGIRLYVDRFQYKGAVQDDVFQALQEAGDTSDSTAIPTTVKLIMDTWTTQSGFPVVRASITNETTLHLTQEKFIQGDPSNEDDTWWVPITLLPKLEPGAEPDIPDVWIPQGTREIDVTIDTAQLIIVNPFATGYYRVMYDTRMRQKIEEQLLKNHEIIPAASRSQILDDYFSLAAAGYISYDLALDLTKYVGKETDLAVWKTVLKNMQQIYNVFSGTGYEVTFKKYVSGLLEDSLEQLDGTNADRGIKAILKSDLLEWSSRMGDTTSKSVLFVRESIRKWKQDALEDAIPINLQDSVYCGAITSESNLEQEKEESIWNFIYEKYTGESFPSHRSRLARALTCTTNENKQNWLLKQIFLNGDKLHEQDKVPILQYLAANQKAKNAIVEYLKNKEFILWETLKSPATVLKVVSTLSYSLNSEDDIQFMERLLSSNSEHLDADLKGYFKDVEGRVNDNARWRYQFAETISKWFQVNSDID